MFQSECAVGVVPALRLTHHLLSGSVRNKCGRRRVGWGNDADFNECSLKRSLKKCRQNSCSSVLPSPKKFLFTAVKHALQPKEASLLCKQGFLALRTSLVCDAKTALLRWKQGLFAWFFRRFQSRKTVWFLSCGCNVLGGSKLRLIVENAGKSGGEVSAAFWWHYRALRKIY